MKNSKKIFLNLTVWSFAKNVLAIFSVAVASALLLLFSLLLLLLVLFALKIYVFSLLFLPVPVKNSKKLFVNLNVCMKRAQY